MAFTPSAWIPSEGPFAGAQDPEMSWRGAAPPDFWSAAVSICALAADACGRSPCANADDDNIKIDASEIVIALKRLIISILFARKIGQTIRPAPRSSQAGLRSSSGSV